MEPVRHPVATRRTSVPVRKSNAVSAPFRFDYQVGVEVANAAELPVDFSVINIPAMRYTIFTHHDYVLKLSSTIDVLYHQWLPNSGRSFRQPILAVPYLIERYDELFNPQTARGDIELWIPVELKQ